eukprot:1159348-Pelagomonas_calceolata.AAC.6
MAVHESQYYVCKPLPVAHPTPEHPATFTGLAVDVTRTMAGCCHGGQVGPAYDLLYCCDSLEQCSRLGSGCNASQAVDVTHTGIAGKYHEELSLKHAHLWFKPTLGAIVLLFACRTGKLGTNGVPRALTAVCRLCSVWLRSVKLCSVKLEPLLFAGCAQFGCARWSCAQRKLLPMLFAGCAEWCCMGHVQRRLGRTPRLQPDNPANFSHSHEI